MPQLHVGTAADTWLSVASRYGIPVNEMIRANPNAKATLAAGTKLFIPPCNNGVLQ